MTTPESTLRKAQEAVAAIAAEVRLFDGVSPRKHQIREWADQLDEIHRALAAQAGDGCVIAGSEQPSAVHALQESAMFRATQPREQAGAGAVAWRSRMPGDTRWLLTEHEPTVPGIQKHPLYAAPCPRAEGVP